MNFTEASNATLITWDDGMLQRGPVVVPTMTPLQWMEGQKASA